MKSYQKIQVKRKSIDDPVACVMIFLLILGLSLLVAKLTHNYLSQINYCFLFLLAGSRGHFLNICLTGLPGTVNGPIICPAGKQINKAYFISKIL